MKKAKIQIQPFFLLSKVENKKYFFIIFFVKVENQYCLVTSCDSYFDAVNFYL